MIDDPDEPGYRYPIAGERYWHTHWHCWVVIDPEQTPGWRIIGEVAATVDSDDARDTRLARGTRVGVKLKSLELSAHES